jgi:hypothetical protein
MLNFIDILVIGDEFLKEDADVLRNDRIKLLHVLGGNLLVVLDDSIEMVAADSDLVEDELEEQFQETEDVLRLDLLVFVVSEDLLDLLD